MPPTIIADSRKKPLAKGTYYPLGYTDFETCFAGRSDRDLHLLVAFGAGMTAPVHDQTYFFTIHLEFIPAAQLPIHANTSWPETWRILDDITLVRASCHELPLAVRGVVSRDTLRDLLNSPSDALASDIWDERWKISVVLDLGPLCLTARRSIERTARVETFETTIPLTSK
jgi:hypothetical protein